MITKQFIINLHSAIQNKQPCFQSNYNKNVLRLIEELINNHIIMNIEYKNLKNKKKINVYLNISTWSTKKTNVFPMASIKKTKNFKVTELTQKINRGNLYILLTPLGYRTSHWCIKKNIGGLAILKLQF